MRGGGTNPELQGTVAASRPCLLIKFNFICASGIMYGYMLYGHLLLLYNSDIS